MNAPQDKEPTSKPTDPTAGSPPSSSHNREVAKEQAKRRQDRRQAWHWNGKLAVITAVVMLIVLIGSGVSYHLNSVAAASTFLDRAEAAADESKFDEQAKWLRRYSMMNPDDKKVVVDMALAADAAADGVPAAQRGAAIYNARKRLGEAIARLGSNPDDLTTEDEESIRDLRGRLIVRLLQLDQRLYGEAERQIILYQAPPRDPLATKQMARALLGQAQAGNYKERNRNAGGPSAKDTDYWRWLSNQTVGEVLDLSVKYNPDDLDTVSRFLSAYQQFPELFTDDSPGGAVVEANLTGQVERALNRLSARDDSRSKLIVYSFEMGRDNEDEALALLLPAAEAALERLAEFVPTGDDEKEEDDEPSDTLVTALAEEMPAYYWDYLIAAEGASRLARTDRDRAALWYDQLVALDLDMIPEANVANVFFTAGTVQEIAGNREKAIAIWEQGLERVSDVNLNLLGAIAGARVQTEGDPKADVAVDDFRAAIKVSTQALNRKSESEIDTAQRMAITRFIDAARWRLNRVEAYLSQKNGDLNDAISRLQGALSDGADVDDDERLIVATQLAALFTARGNLDQAAAALERAVTIAPDNMALRAQAAQAAMRAGNRLPAIEQWRIVGSSDSMPLQVLAVEAQFNHEVRLAPEERDFSAVRSEVRRLNRKVASQGEDDAATIQVMGEISARLDVLQASLPPSGVSLEEHLQSEAFAKQVSDIAGKYANDTSVQAFAAERLAAGHADEEADKATARLTSSLGEDSVTVAIVKARVRGKRGEPAEASRDLIAFAEAHPELATGVLPSAAILAQEAVIPNLAYEALASIPDEERPLAQTFSLTELARLLPDDSPHLTVDGKQISQDELVARWADKLKESEGDDGTYWRYLQARDLIVELREDPNRIERTDARLKEAQGLAKQILSLRPDWGNAISLEGSLLAIENKPEEAVKQLRRGIDAGDRRLQTRLELWEQLNKLERFGEAEREIRLAAFASDTPLESYAGLRVRIARNQGDFGQGIRIAEAAVEANPDDFQRRVLLCSAATNAARNATSSEDREKYLDLADEAAAKAAELSAEDNAAVFDARLIVAIERNDRDRIEKEQAMIDASSLNDFSKAMLQSRAFQGLDDNTQAAKQLERADKLRPSAGTKLRLAGIYRSLGRAQDEINVLREARELAPENATIRNDLARAMVTRDGETINWNDLNELLASGEEVTPANRLLYAILLSQRGNERQTDEAIIMLRELYQEENSRSEDAARVLVILLQAKLNDLPESSSTSRKRVERETRTMHDFLTKKRNVLPLDLYRYADFLLDLGLEADMLQVQRLRKQLDGLSVREAKLASLELDIRIAQREGRVEEAPDLLEQWVEEVGADGSLGEEAAASIAGTSLLRLGFKDEAAEWFALAYKQNPEAMLGQYVVVLNKIGDARKAIEVSGEHYNRFASATAAVLLVESLMNDLPTAAQPKYRQLVDKAMMVHGENPALIEGVATLSMMQSDYEGAVAMFQKILEREPTRVRALNNLAMALSEIPGRAAEGIGPIDRALELAGNNPELLDTKGAVLLKAGRPQDAQREFQNAYTETGEQRFLFHVIVALMAQEKTAEARHEWTQLKLENLNVSGLTPSEREQLDALKAEFK